MTVYYYPPPLLLFTVQIASYLWLILPLPLFFLHYWIYPFFPTAPSHAPTKRFYGTGLTHYVDCLLLLPCFHLVLSAIQLHPHFFGRIPTLHTAAYQTKHNEPQVIDFNSNGFDILF